MANDTTTKEKTEPEKPVEKTEGEVKKNNNDKGKTIAIAVLSTVVGCFIIVLAVLLCTGVIKFSDPNDGAGDISDSSHHDGRDDGDDCKRHKRVVKDEKDGSIDNPYPEVTVNGATMAEVDDLRFYLPSHFKAGGKDKNTGAYVYNLTDDDGWAQVSVYAEKSSLSPERYLNKISDYLDITDDDYEINGTTWVQGENANALAYATKLGDKIYAVYYVVRLDSDASAEAMQTIPKTLYMKKIVADED